MDKKEYWINWLEMSLVDGDRKIYQHALYDSVTGWDAVEKQLEWLRKRDTVISAWVCFNGGKLVAHEAYYNSVGARELPLMSRPQDI